MLETYHLNVFKCILCEEIIFAEHKSSTCPFCGAHDHHIILAKDWKQSNHKEIFSERSRKNLIKALKLEQESVRFYKCSISHTHNVKIQATFKGFLRVETEHVLLISRALKIQRPNSSMENICFRLDRENIEMATKIEREATKFYLDSFHKATEQRVKDIFSGLAEIEKDHAKLLENIAQIEKLAS